MPVAPVKSLARTLVVLVFPVEPGQTALSGLGAMTQSASVSRLGSPDAMIPDKEAIPGSQRGSHLGERLPAPGGRIRTGGWRSRSPRLLTGAGSDRYWSTDQKAGLRVHPSAPPSAQVSATF